MHRESRPIEPAFTFVVYFVCPLLIGARPMSCDWGPSVGRSAPELIAFRPQCEVDLGRSGAGCSTVAIEGTVRADLNGWSILLVRSVRRHRRAPSHHDGGNVPFRTDKSSPHHARFTPSRGPSRPTGGSARASQVRRPLGGAVPIGRRSVPFVAGLIGAADGVTVRTCVRHSAGSTRTRRHSWPMSIPGYLMAIPASLRRWSSTGPGATIDFYADVLGATVRMHMDGPDHRVGHAELQLGDSVIMVADEFPEMGYLGPKRVGGTPVTLSVYVEDADSVFQKAMSAGATELRPVENRILRRSFGTVRGSVRPSIERGHPRRGRLRGRDDAAREGGHESGLIIDRRVGSTDARS